MKICIVGVGAIGGFIGARLASKTNADVCALARGSSLKAMQKHGWRLQQAEELVQAPARAAADAKDLGVQDVVILALKSPVLPGLASSLEPLIGEHTMVVSAMNGVPWWFVQGMDVIGDIPLQSVNPGGIVSSSIPYKNTVGAVIHASASRSEPGFVQHAMGKGIILGEPAGGKTPRVQSLVDILLEAGFDAKHSDNVRQDIWYKLWGNMTMNPVSAITGATADKILSDPLVRQFCSAAMKEAAALGKYLNCPITEDPEARHQITAKLGAFKTSMLQDVEADRAIELDAIVGAVCEIGQRLGVAIPNIDALYGLTRLFARTRNMYPSDDEAS